MHLSSVIHKFISYTKHSDNSFCILPIGQGLLIRWFSLPNSIIGNNNVNVSTFWYFEIHSAIECWISALGLSAHWFSRSTDIVSWRSSVRALAKVCFTFGEWRHARSHAWSHARSHAWSEANERTNWPIDIFPSFVVCMYRCSYSMTSNRGVISRLRRALL